MKNENIKQTFIDATENWICDGYSASIRYIAGVNNGVSTIWDALIILTPLPISAEFNFEINGENVKIGQIQLITAPKDELVQHIHNALQGRVETSNQTLILPDSDTKFNYHTDSTERDLWYYQLHLQISGKNNFQSISDDRLSTIDNLLRLSTPPFDGLNDAANWLELKNINNTSRTPVINISVSPPVDLEIRESSLLGNQFRVVLLAHPNLNVERISLAIRGVPGNLSVRNQIASKIVWGDVQNNKRTGIATIQIPNCDAVLAMLLIGNTLVRRQWFLDPNKARNTRLLAVQAFDKNLKMIKSSVLETTDSKRFEQGVAALLFLLGFSPCLQIESDSPDIIVQTPSGRIVLIECTLKISDFHAKLGKLVDRRGALNKELEQSGHPSQIAIALICRLPRDQIAVDQGELAGQKAILVAQDELLNIFNRVREHHDPDKILEDAEAELISNKQLKLNI